MFISTTTQTVIGRWVHIIFLLYMCTNNVHVLVLISQNLLLLSKRCSSHERSRGKLAGAHTLHVKKKTPSAAHTPTLHVSIIV